MTSLRVLSLFSGIGGFDLGLQRAGMRVVAQAECEFAQRGPRRGLPRRRQDNQALLARHWPGVPQLGDVRMIDADTIRRLGPVDLVCGGFPCQDLSVAGRRAGLAGARSRLWWEFHRILAVARPRWVVVENVPGLLSSNRGRDMGALLGSLGDLGYGFAYRVLDAQFFGLAQRRKRVFIVGGLGDRAGPAAVLLEPEGGGGDPAPGRQPTQDLAGTVDAGTASCGGAGDLDRMTFVPGGPNGRLRVGVTSTAASGAGRSQTDATLVGHTLTAHGARFEPHAETYVAHTLTAVGGSEDGTGRGTPLVACHGTAAPMPPRPSPEPGPGPGPEPGGDVVGAVAVSFNQRAEGRERGVHGALAAQPSGKQYNGVRQGLTVRRLTPRECERLQGFPDDYTAGQADSVRYRQLGNSLAVPVAEWIGRRIVWRTTTARTATPAADARLRLAPPVHRQALAADPHRRVGRPGRQPHTGGRGQPSRACPSSPRPDPTAASSRLWVRAVSPPQTPPAVQQTPQPDGPGRHPAATHNHQRLAVNDRDHTLGRGGDRAHPVATGRQPVSGLPSPSTAVAL